jgi:hypothetical protein
MPVPAHTADAGRQQHSSAVYSDFVKIEGDAYDPLQGRGFGKSFRNFIRRAMECFGIGQIGKKAALLAAQAKRRKPSGPNDWLRFAKACLFEKRCVGLEVAGVDMGAWGC